MKTIRKILMLAIVLVAGTFTSCTDYQDEINALDYRVTELEKMAKRINSDLESLQIIADALENADYITNVTPNSEGYIITFKKAGAVLIRNGKDGLDGQDAQMPDISMKKGADGFYYWTLNGEFVVSPDGNLVRASGKDGIDGQDGQDGKDGKDGVAIAPKVRINEQTLYWEVSYDGGATWITTNIYSKGKDGKDGKDAQAPEISAQVGPDGDLYWTINGTFITTSDGGLIRANGKDGKDGENGKDGRAIAPQVRINPQTIMWEISYDGGTTWINTGTSAKGKDGEDGAKGDKGKDGTDGQDGAKGKDGKDGDVVIKSVQFMVVDGVTMARFYLASGYFDVPIVLNS